MLLQQIEGSNAFYVSGSRGDAEGFFPDMTKEQIMYKESEDERNTA